ncbi:MAG: hypothetical protein ACC645_22645 [Pirellulales bacterium]
MPDRISPGLVESFGTDPMVDDGHPERLPARALDDRSRAGIIAAAAKMRDRHGWQDAARGFLVERTWVKTSSQNVFHLLTTIPGGEQIVLKIEASAGAEDARALHDAMSNLVEVLEGAAEATTGLQPIGWLETPPMVATQYVEGVDLVDILQDASHAAWQHDDTILGVANAAGAALAVFHRSVVPGRHSDHPRTTDSTKRLSRRLVLPPATTSILATEAGRASAMGRRYGDFGPGNIRLSTSGNVYVLDPPTKTTSSLVHRDIAYFEFQVKKNLAGRGTAKSSDSNSYIEGQLRTAFLTGYGTESSFDPNRDQARALVAAYQAAYAVGMARKRVRQRRWQDASWAIASAASLRREAVRAANRARS